ncbi:MAG: ABC transporter substrate-binding protein [Pyramidobacter sp.]|nr:ABC transporter substrate-binding protein [Pyramidobacter sp.]
MFKKLAAACAALCLSVLPAEALELKYAKNLTIEERPGGWTVEIKHPWPGSRETFVHEFRDASRPGDWQGAPDALVLPLTRVAVSNLPSAWMIDALGAGSAIKGLGGARYICSPSLKSIKAAALDTPGSMGSEIDPEKLLSLNVQALMTYVYTGAEVDLLRRMERLGIPVLLSAGYCEAHPLARAEWIKLTGVLFGRLDEAIRFFDETEARYLELKKRAAQAVSRPQVLLDAPLGGQWRTAGKNSWFTAYVRDAGGDPLFADGEKSRVMDLESVIAGSQGATHWLLQGFGSLPPEGTAEARRYEMIPPWRTGQVYSATARAQSGGGNDFYESGPSRPDLILADIVAILHPDLLPGHVLYYYRKGRS